MKLNLYLPTFDDLWFRQRILEDEETMSYNHAWGGTIPFPKEDWLAWYERWVLYPEEKRFYRYLKNEDGDFVGEVAYHYDSHYQGYVADVIIFAKYRHRGYGDAGLKLLCSAAKEAGIAEIYDDIAIDNPAISLFLKQGFTEQYRTKDIILLKKAL